MILKLKAYLLHFYFSSYSMVEGILAAYLLQVWSKAFHTVMFWLIDRYDMFISVSSNMLLSVLLMCFRWVNKINMILAGQGTCLFWSVLLSADWWLYLIWSGQSNIRGTWWCPGRGQHRVLTVEVLCYFCLYIIFLLYMVFLEGCHPQNM